MKTTITLTEEKLKELNDFFQEIPTKYGMVMINFFNKLIEEQKSKEEEIIDKEVD